MGEAIMVIANPVVPQPEWAWYRTGARIPCDEVGTVTVTAWQDGWYQARNRYGNVTVVYHP